MWMYMGGQWILIAKCVVYMYLSDCAIIPVQLAAEKWGVGSSRSLVSKNNLDTESWDQCYTCNFFARFCRATLSLDKVAACNCACRTLQLCCCINKHWPSWLVISCLCDKVAVCDMHILQM